VGKLQEHIGMTNVKFYSYPNNTTTYIFWYLLVYVY